MPAGLSKSVAIPVSGLLSRMGGQMLPSGRWLNPDGIPGLGEAPRRHACTAPRAR